MSKIWVIEQRCDGKRKWLPIECGAFLDWTKRDAEAKAREHRIEAVQLDLPCEYRVMLYRRFE